MNTTYEAWIQQTDATTFNVGVYVWRTAGICGPSFSDDVTGPTTRDAWDAAKAAIGKAGFVAIAAPEVKETFDGPVIKFPVVLR